MPDKNIALLEKIKSLDAALPEKRSSRILVLTTPSIHDKLKALSKETGISVNSIINAAISEYID